jgi:drug/metabolite transporter (DMT)-like permease
MFTQILFLFLSGVSFSIMSLFVKFANQAHIADVSYTLSAFTTVLLRTSPMLPVIVFWAFHDWKKIKKNSVLHFSKSEFMWLNARGIVGTASMFCVFYGNIHLPLGTSVVLYNTNPFFLAVLAPLLLNEKTNLINLSAALLGFLFIAILMKDSSHFGSGNFLLFDAFVTLGGGLFSAMAYSSVKNLSRLPSSWVILSLTLWGIVVALLFAPELPKHGTALYWAMASSVPAFFGQIFLTKAYQKGNAQIIAPAQYFGPVAATFLGILFLNESLTVPKIIGSVGIVCCGISLPVLKLGTKKKPERKL